MTDRDRILAELRKITAAIAAADGTIQAAYPRRQKLLRRGRKAGIYLRELGEACGVSETAIIKALKDTKYDQRPVRSK